MANSLCWYINEKRRKRGEDLVEQIDFTHSSRKAWSLLNRLTGKAKQFRPLPVTASAIASRLVENGRYKKPDRQYSISVRKAVHQLRANTHSDVNLCQDFSTLIWKPNARMNDMFRYDCGEGFYWKRAKAFIKSGR